MADDSHAAHEAEGGSTDGQADPPGGADPPEHDLDPATRRRDGDTPGSEGGKHYEPL